MIQTKAIIAGSVDLLSDRINAICKKLGNKVINVAISHSSYDHFAIVIYNDEEDINNNGISR